MIALATRPTSTNGVPLYTKQGKPRRRFRYAEYLRVLGCSDGELEHFANLFAPYRARHIVRRTRDGEVGPWTTSNHILYDEDIIRHLIGDRLPGREPMWVGGFAFETTRWAAVDVDLRGDERDFRNRCNYVEKQLRLLGIPKSALLIVTTPSGGRHYYFFFHRQERTAEIREVLQLVGINHEPGRFEVFPSQTQGLRLPFGHSDQAPPGPNDWLMFIRRKRRRDFPLVNWGVCTIRAQALFEWRVSNPQESDRQCRLPSTKSSIPSNIAVDRMTTDTGKTSVLRKKDDPQLRPRQRTYLAILSADRRSPSQIEELMGLGICVEGTRVMATKQIAWHLVFVRGLCEREAARQCID